MTNAQQLFVAYGVIAITYGVLLGSALAAVRASTPEAPKHLVTTHLEGLMQGPMHLSLAFAVGITGFDSGTATVAAVLLVIGSGLNLLGHLTHWLTGTGDQFAERSPGFLLNAASGPLITVGAVITSIGVLTNL